MPQEPSYLILQCRWLNHKSDKQQFNIYFTAYYNALAKEFLPYLASVLKHNHKCPSTHHDIFQELMFYLGNIKEGREIAYAQLKKRAPLVASTTDNVFLANRVTTWGGKISTWADQAKNFCACQWPDGNPPECEVKAYAINQELNPLRGEAENLIQQHSGKSETAHNAQAIDDEEEIEFSDSFDGLEQATSISDDLPVEMRAVLALASKVRIPMKGLFYWKAQKLIIDCSRNKGNLPLTRSTSLSGNEQEDEIAPDDSLVWNEAHQPELDPLNTGHEVNPDDEDEDEPDSEGLIGTIGDGDDNDFKERNLRKVEALLYADVKAAETVRQSASTPSERKRAQGRLDNELKNFAFRYQVCDLLLQGYDEVEIIRQLQTTREKARYAIEKVFKLLHDGFKVEFGDFRREQTLQKVLPIIKNIAVRYEAPLATAQPFSEKPPHLLTEFERLLEAPVKKAESALRKAEAEKRQVEDKWLVCCFETQRKKLLAPEEERILRQDYLQWLSAENLSHRELALRLHLKPDEVAKHRQKKEKATQDIQRMEDALNLTRTEHQQDSPKILAVLRILVSESSLAEIAQTLGLADAEVEQILTLLSA